MKLALFSVRDSAAEAFMRPFPAPTAGMAVRNFTDEANRADPQNPMYAHPSDYELYHVGFFDEETGKLEPIDPVMVVRAKDCRTGGA